MTVTDSRAHDVLPVRAVPPSVPTRRSVLAGALGAAGAAGLAGCTGRERLRTDSFELGRYLFAPGPFGRDHYSFYFARPRRIDALRNHLSLDTREFLSRRVDVANPADLPFSAITDHVIADPNSVAMRVDADAAALGERLRGEGFRRTGSDREYALYETTANEPRADAVVTSVRDGLLLSCEYGSREGARARVTAMAEAGAGERARYADAEPVLGALLDQLAGATVGVGKTRPAPGGTNPQVGIFAGLVADGFGVRMGPELTTNRAGFVFRRASDVDRGAIEEYVSTQRAARDEADLRFSVSVEGRVVTVDWTFPTADF